MEEIAGVQFWTALLEIIGINVILSGDNAVVIALACRTLPPVQQRRAILFGTVAAIGLRVVLTGFAVYLLHWAYLKLAGSVLLLWIAIKLLLPEAEGDGDGPGATAGMLAAIRTIVIADFVMSLDNVLGVAAAAKGSLALLIAGLVISMPIIMYGSALIMKIMGRFPVIVTLGGALLGFVAGEMAVSDEAVSGWIEQHALHTLVPLLAAVFVVAVGRWFSRSASESTSI